jgi:hypothetical protein
MMKIMMQSVLLNRGGNKLYLTLVTNIFRIPHTLVFLGRPDAQVLLKPNKKK